MLLLQYTTTKPGADKRNNTMKNSNTTQGVKVANPFSNNEQVKQGLTQMFGSKVAEQITTKDVYKYSQTEEEQLAFFKKMGVKTYQKRHADGTTTTHTV
jgi:hypothetical protein